jgi:hypothetical protein
VLFLKFGFGHVVHSLHPQFQRLAFYSLLHNLRGYTPSCIRLKTSLEFRTHGPCVRTCQVDYHPLLTTYYNKISLLRWGMRISYTVLTNFFIKWQNKGEIVSERYTLQLIKHEFRVASCFMIVSKVTIYIIWRNDVDAHIVVIFRFASMGYYDSLHATITLYVI